jgi:septal ring factor EnvC (AmiA/AmiB activator)
MDIRKMTDLAGWAQAGIAGLIAALGAMFFIGNANSQLRDAQADIVVLQAKQAKDHDKVTVLETKVDQIHQDVAETKQDVKTVLQNQADVKAALERFNRRGK